MWDPLQIKSDYHSASYKAKNLDTWMYTNSTEVTFRYPAWRLGQLKAIKIILRGWLFWKHWLDSEIKLKFQTSWKFSTFEPKGDLEFYL